MWQNNRNGSTPPHAFVSIEFIRFFLLEFRLVNEFFFCRSSMTYVLRSYACDTRLISKIVIQINIEKKTMLLSCRYSQNSDENHFSTENTTEKKKKWMSELIKTRHNLNDLCKCKNRRMCKTCYIHCLIQSFCTPWKNINDIWCLMPIIWLRFDSENSLVYQYVRVQRIA